MRLRAADPNLDLRQMLPLLAQFDEEGSKLRRFAKPRQQWIGLEQRVTRKAVGGGLLDPVLRACEVSELRVDSANRIGGVMKVDEPPSTRDRLVNVCQRASAIAPLHAQHGARRVDDAALIVGARRERVFDLFRGLIKPSEGDQRPGQLVRPLRRVGVARNAP